MVYCMYKLWQAHPICSNNLGCPAYVYCKEFLVIILPFSQTLLCFAFRLLMEARENTSRNFGPIFHNLLIYRTQWSNQRNMPILLVHIHLWFSKH